MPFTLAAKVAAEAVGMFFVIFVGESALANELLPKTKGRGMGFGWVSLAFGLSFFPPIVVFGDISATFNPAVLMAKLVLGTVNAKEFFALFAAQMLGGFIGAIFVWLHYLPHFKTVPEPPTSDSSELLLRTRDSAQQSNLAISSYSTQAQKQVGPVEAIKDLWYYLGDPDKHFDIDGVLGAHGAHDVEGRLRRRSVQVADMHRKLEELHLDEKFRMPEVRTSLTSYSTGMNNGKVTDGPTENQSLKAEVEREKALARLRKLHENAIIADQNMKLSIFCTRPAVNSPLLNLWAEFVATAALVTGSELIVGAKDDMDAAAMSLYWPVFGGFILGFFVFIIIAGLGGPTGAALNPARDFAPRLAHFVLPIPGKGTSEWAYSWVPVLGSLLGGVAAAGFLHILDKLKHP